jgi:hypothetical protein
MASQRTCATTVPGWSIAVRSMLKFVLRLRPSWHPCIKTKEIRDYQLTAHAHGLFGQQGADVFFIYLGNPILGANGKGTRGTLYMRTIGSYGYNMGAQVLSRPSGASGSTSSELAKCRGKRWVIMSEPDEIIRNDLVKTYCGGDKVQARELFRSPIEFKSVAIFELQCNEMPVFNKQDGGTARRTRVVKHLTMFKPDPNPRNKYEQKLDASLRNKFDGDIRYAQQYMIMLLEQVEQGKDKLPEVPPRDIKEWTEDNLESTNMYKTWINERLEVTHNEQDAIPRKDLWLDFKESSHFVKGIRDSSFYVELEKAGFEQRRTHVGQCTDRYFFGVQLRPQYSGAPSDGCMFREEATIPGLLN